MWRATLIVAILSASSAAAAISPESIATLTKILAYDEGLATRLAKDPVPVLSVGFDCARWPKTARIAGHATSCEPAALSAALVGDAAARGGVVLLGELEPAQVSGVAAQARDANVPVLALRQPLASEDVLLTAEGSKVLLGERAIKRLGAKFPAAILRMATIVSAVVAEEEPTVRELSREGEYPDEAREANVEGVVRLKLTVDVEGRVTDVSVVKGLGFGLDEEAVRRVRRSRFNPGRRGGVPVTMNTTFNVRFTLQD